MLTAHRFCRGINEPILQETSVHCESWRDHDRETSRPATAGSKSDFVHDKWWLDESPPDSRSVDECEPDDRQIA
jgi:hypothetical protein